MPHPVDVSLQYMISSLCQTCVLGNYVCYCSYEHLGMFIFIFTTGIFRQVLKKINITRNTFCGTWYLPLSHVHNEQTVPIIMAGCMMHEREGYISTSGPKSDVTVVFLDPDFL